MDQAIAARSRESRLNIWLALAAAFLAFRIVQFIAAIACLKLLWLVVPSGLFWRANSFAPIVISLIAVSAAVGVAFWQSGYFQNRPAGVKIACAVGFTLLSLLPFYPRVEIKPVPDAQIDIAVRDGYSPDTIEIILKKYPELVDGFTLRNRPGVWTPLANAAYLGRTNVVEMLIRYHASTNRALKCLEEVDATNAIELIKDKAKR